MFVYFNFKAIFGLALVATLANFVVTQNLYTSILDDTRSALMSFSSGSSSPKPKPIIPAFPPLFPGARPPVFRKMRVPGGSWGSSKFFMKKKKNR